MREWHVVWQARRLKYVAVFLSNKLLLHSCYFDINATLYVPKITLYIVIEFLKMLNYYKWIYERSSIWTAEKDIKTSLIIAVIHTTYWLIDPSPKRRPKIQMVQYWKRIPALERRLYDCRGICIIPPVIQTSVMFSILNFHFLSWYYTWNAETWQGYLSKRVLSSAGIRFWFKLILTCLNFRLPVWRRGYCEIKAWEKFRPEWVPVGPSSLLAR